MAQSMIISRNDSKRCQQRWMKIVLKVIEKRLAMSSWSSSRLLQFNLISMTFPLSLSLSLLQLKSWNELINRLNRIKIIACSISLITIHSAEDVWMLRYVLLRFISFIRRLHILCWKPSTPRFSSAACSFQAPIQHQTSSLQAIKIFTISRLNSA